MNRIPYAKVTSALFQLNKETSISIVVNLLRKIETKSGMEYTKYFRRDIQYTNEKFNGKVRNINLDFDYYLQIKCSSKIYGNNNNQSVSVLFGEEDMYEFRKGLILFYNDYIKYKDKIYFNDNGRLMVNKSIMGSMYIDDLIFGAIRFFPGTDRNINEELYPCICMELLNNDAGSCVTHIIEKKFRGMIEVIRNCNLYLYAQNLALNYGKEEEVTVYDMDSKKSVITNPNEGFNKSDGFAKKENPWTNRSGLSGYYEKNKNNVDYTPGESIAKSKKEK